MNRDFFIARLIPWCRRASASAKLVIGRIVEAGSAGAAEARSLLRDE